MAGAAVDSAGNVYASGIHPAGTFIASIFKLSAAGTLLSTFSWSPGNGPLQPTGMAFDSNGNLFTADYSGNKVWQISASGPASQLTPLAVNPQGVAFDALGNLFVSFTASGSVAKISPAADVTGFASGVSDPAGLAFDSTGDLFAATGTSLTRIKPDGTIGTSITGLNSAQFIANRTATVPEPGIAGAAMLAFLFRPRRRRPTRRSHAVPS